jgi:hypothetical protein
MWNRTTLRLLLLQSIFFLTAYSSDGQGPCALGAPTIRSNSGYYAICGKSPLLLASSSPTGNRWLGNGVPLDSTGASLVVTQAGAYQLVVTGTAGCRDSSVVVDVVADPGPPVPVLSASGPTTICSGSSVTLSCTSDVGNQWYDNNLALAGITGSEYLATGVGVYFVQVTDETGCWALSNAITVTVNPNKSGSLVLPAVSPGGPLTFCGDTAVWLVSTPAVNFQWFSDGYALPGANGDSLQVTQSGSYAVATGTAGCGSVGGMSAAVAVNFLAEQTPVVTMNNGVLVSSIATGNQWYRNNGIIRGATDQQYTPQQPGSYAVQVEFGVRAVDTTTFQIGVGGCYSAFSAPFVITDSILTSPQVLAFPNPVSSVLTLSSKRPGPVTIRVFDMMGRAQLEQPGVTGTVELDVSRWAKGVYILQMTDQATQATEKAVIVKM